MAARCKVRQDDRGLYILHGRAKARPVIPAASAVEFGDENNPYRDLIERRSGKTICWNNQTRHAVGTVVLKTHHTQTNRCTVMSLDGMQKEIWFLHAEECKNEKPFEHTL